MTQQEIYDQVYKLIFEESGGLSRPEYGNLLNDIIDDCQTAINAMNEDDPELE